MTKNAKTKILVVDDDKEFLEEVQEMLTLSGYEIAVASDPDLALEKILTEKPSIMLLDLKMAPKSGFQIADELVNKLGLKNIFIIAMTGFFTEKEHNVFMKLCGIKKCILKPIKPLDLIANIEFGAEKRNAVTSGV
jgi:DNA-binding response OmpR family regulator